MDQHTDRHIKPGGRTIAVTGFGNTAEEIELMALDEARRFFGSDIKLEIMRDYVVRKPVILRDTARAEALGAAYCAYVLVRAGAR